MTNWDKTQDWHARDRLQQNVGIIVKEVEPVRAAIGEGAPLYCLGRTAGGYPMHPLSRGKHKVPKNAPLMPWRAKP